MASPTREPPLASAKEQKAGGGGEGTKLLMSSSPLPIAAFEDAIVKAVEDNSAVVVIGATGSGKSTQIAQFLLRGGVSKNGAIAVTQPRRVAAVSVARRVAQEMGATLGEEVGYTVRFDDRTAQSSRIIFQTDGCLLQEIVRDPQLRRYSVVVLDEAHERSLNTDILFGLLKSLVASREPPLKLVVTSATLDGQKFSAFFRSCPVIDVPGRLHPVEVFFSLERPASYFESAVQTAVDLHAREAPGDILVFFTGQDEIDRAVRALEEKISELEEGSCMDAVILPLHASLPPELQVRVFAPPPPHCRRIIAATNVAETSVTLDGIVYVVDPGFVKQQSYDPTAQISSLSVVPISRVQAIQRAGRAGRTRAGKCFRLYPKSVFEHELIPATVPEIQRSSLAAAVLHLKSLPVENLDILSFEFLDPPAKEALHDALRELFFLDAIDENGKMTATGRQMAGLPLDPPLSRMLLAAASFGCLDEALTVAAMLSAESTVFFNKTSAHEGAGSEKASTKNRTRVQGSDWPLLLPDGEGFGEHVRLLQVYEAWEESDFSKDWCSHFGVQHRTMLSVRKIRQQLASMMKDKTRNQNQDKEAAEGQKARHPSYSSHSQGRDRSREEERGKEKSKSKKREKVVDGLRRAICASSANRIARRMPRHNGYKTLQEKSQLVQVHPNNAPLHVDDEGLLPEWVVYHEIVVTSRPYMRAVCAAEGRWLDPLLKRIDGADVFLLSGGHTGASKSIDRKPEKESLKASDKKQVVNASPVTVTKESAVDAAKERYLARKKAKKA